MEKKYAPKRSAAEAMPDADVAASDAAAMQAIKKKKKKKVVKKDEQLDMRRDFTDPHNPRNKFAKNMGMGTADDQEEAWAPVSDWHTRCLFTVVFRGRWLPRGHSRL